MANINKLRGNAFIREALERLERLEDHNKYSNMYPKPHFSKEDLEGDIYAAYEDERISEDKKDELMQKLEEAAC